MILKSILSILCLFVLTLKLSAQGNLLLVGGGSESDGGWSDIPYTWLVENANNKKVAIISYSSADQWLPDYFERLGAETAVNVRIANRDEALSDTIAAYLTSFDALFFKGGDQWRYYDYYRDTPVQQAIEDIYNAGGVIGGTSAGMAILSGIMFTAEEGSAFPIDVLENINSRFVTLADDFLNFYPKYFFDTHFIERGRTPRAIGFMAHWFKNENELISAIGIDDRTAFCIDAAGEAVVYGTGAASIYTPESFEISGNQLIDSKVKSIQLTHGQQFNLSNKTRSAVDFSKNSNPQLTNTYYNVFATRALSFSINKTLLDDALATELSEGNITLLTDRPDGVARDYITYLSDDLQRNVQVVGTGDIFNAADSAGLRNNIRTSNLVLVIDVNNIEQFFAGGETGTLLRSHLKRNLITSVFMGVVAERIGSTYCTNIYSDGFNAYFDDLEYNTGLNILPGAFIITNAFELDQKDYYENISSALLDQVLTEELLYGVYLTDNTYVRYSVNSDNQLQLSTHGSISSVVLFNNGTAYQRTDQEVRNNINRTQYAFDSLEYRVTKSFDYDLGAVKPETQTDYVMEEEVVLSNKITIDNDLFVTINPVNEQLRFNEAIEAGSRISIVDAHGKVVHRSVVNVPIMDLDVNALESGIYMISIENSQKNRLFLNKFVKM